MKKKTLNESEDLIKHEKCVNYKYLYIVKT